MQSPGDYIHMQRAIQAATTSTLEAFEANPALLDRARRRFDHDSPPPYSPSTEYDSDPTLGMAELAEMQDILEPPLTDEELELVAKRAAPFYEAGSRLALDYEAELEHLETYYTAYKVIPKLTYLLKYRVTNPRLHIIARAAVRKRWQALGVWNDSWGFINFKLRSHTGDGTAVRDENGQPWAWAWKAEEAPHGETHPVWRAVRLRRGQPRGECPVPPPRSRLTSKSSHDEREAFITSRPWFQSILCNIEERVRWERMTVVQRNLACMAGWNDRTTRARWEERGIWKEEWNTARMRGRPGWKWRHESPSPEPETYLQHGQNIEQDMSPSELEEYESIEPELPSEPPSAYWGPWHPGNDDEQDQTPAEAPPQYTKTAANPESARIKTPPRCGQPPARVQKRTRNSTPPVGLRRSNRAVIVQAKKQEKLAAQAVKEKELAAEAEKKRELAAEAKKKRERAAQAEKKRELAAEAKKKRELAAQPKKKRELAAQAKKKRELAAQAKKKRALAAQPKKKKELADQKKEQKQPTQAAKTTTRARTRAVAASEKQTLNEAKTPAKSTPPKRK
ncbi:hypothetical protein CCM_03422 [Cordyceps militaris CM01]|uniref:Uncharacterized protein n=1 Tax=Cordyceps militaris (strain CM01) TaxID=983644 RepID=G3JAN5_CORMM|nr:uncharacterized protein CCM_03422 [Cordyceps militaris CM01]EGX95150.1 hypothetical protein CCM_03422 [Cordyceps militaris CM01]